jgi:SAM-dependent methyltransferase
MSKDQSAFSIANKVSLDDEPFVKRHQERFIPYFRGKKLVVDLGCGGGRFLQLLSENNIPHIGVETNRRLVETCRNRGLNVVGFDALQYLKRCRPASTEGFFSSHLIEHLHPSEAIQVFQLMGRALRPGGVVVLVTPNCRCLGVITQGFWEDPTHIRPYPAALLQLMGEQNGFRLLKKGEIDMDTSTNRFKNAARAFARGAYRIFRRLLIGNFFRPYDLFMVFEKSGPPGRSDSL